MRVDDSQTIYSASDLVGFAACAHLTQLELLAARGELERPHRDDPLLDLISRRGAVHEAAVLDEFGLDGPVTTIDVGDRSRAGLEAAARATEGAMRRGDRVIYQATFLHDGWLGYADFVVRVDTPSDLGEWSYEVADAKLTRVVRASAIVQLCEYSGHVERIQGCAPAEITIITGDGKRHPLRLADYAAYYRTLKADFLATVAAPSAPPTYPEPVEHCNICRWWSVCTDRRRADDHLSLVAGARAEQRRRLGAIGIDTRHALAAGPESLEPSARINAASYAKLRAQAALQVRGDGCLPPLFELIEPSDLPDGAPPQGLAILPEPSPGDLFLDLEGDPYAAEGGLEYLFGLVSVDGGEPEYHAFWGHDKAGERRAFEAAVDLIVEYRRRWPDMHVFHYSPHEPSAFKRLMGEHGTREDEIDDLLRGEVFVDLFSAVRRGVRLSVESYSLKQVEKLYFKRPDGGVMTAGSSIVAYENYLERDDPTLLDEIAAYNRDDCETMIGLREWLEARRTEAIARWGPIDRPTPPPVPEFPAEPNERTQLVAALLRDLPVDEGERSDEQHAQYLLAHLLEWHRREAKPAWWKYFERLNTYEPGQFTRDGECIGGLVHDREVGPLQRSIVHRFRFEAQEHKFRAGSDTVDPATQAASTVVDVGDNWIDLKRTAARWNTFPTSLMPGQPYFNNEQRDAIAEVAQWVLAHDIDASGDYRALRDMLLRRLPRGPGNGEPLLSDGEVAVDGAGRLALALDRGCLAVQGPPGAGKTFTGARMIVTALRAGKSVGITATTHGAITNLLEEVERAAHKCGFALHGMQRIDAERSTPIDGIECSKDSGEVEHALLSGEVHLAAGTSWLWTRPGLRGSVDLLFVDEAGQMSLADAVAVGTAARNIVLLGDPQQLAQPSTGSHPDGAGASALEHVLGRVATVARERGLFLPETYRMHPLVCRFISEIAYESRLASAPGRERQMIEGRAGLWFLPVEHQADRTRSRDEAGAVAELYGELVGRDWVDDEGEKHELEVEHIIVVAPYNAQVAELKAKLPEGARVGTVDKFQGGEGVVAVYSMASSSAEDAPRGMNFLYDLHRLNVAVSRARARAYVVASPHLLRVMCHDPNQLRLANALCRYVEYAADQLRN